MNAENMQQMQLIEQNLQQFLMQKQQFQQAIIETESALKELETSKESYKILGGVMLSTSKEDLQKELSTKNEELNLRIKTLETQERKLKEKADELRNEIMKETKNESK
ncbi:prefoldin subunit beta [Candidatus Woesearchaeota archaeon]|jgi:prefoldin beta subunit|nr:prefoldin subunit beta [Candidatus Woesearchaeota archaeon]MBT4368001.1 prefoldin subunit beta [Candidatus Woesearchaeota archaeon]MBT4712489.1 prefoldin subunit beta [Candidatus Woesearchaeota archaeon]MBT6639402.1 prefoldin subunit beta [Candidatus Woesearchaeota archaeon]MBT7133574.1 prefoldin subunit beta [Candidatus Woesearchaeota archaeon]